MQEAPNKLGLLALLAVLVAGSFLILFSLGDHPFYGRSDVRYAEVSREMLQQGEWLVPHKRGQAHLTKPPLVYWLEAGAMEAFGPNELAARLPSALAGCATLAIVAALAWKRHGSYVAILAAGMLAIMPLHVIVSRLPLTDGVLGCLWFATLACGLLAVEEPAKRRWVILMWLSAALGFLAKGPQALIPVAILVAWLALAGRWRDLRSLGLWWGLPLSAAPLLAWVAIVLAMYPSARSLWLDDLLARNQETPAHIEPWWYYLPMLLVGLFPATLSMRVPLLSISGRETLARFRAGDDKALWLLAIFLPLLGFSLRSGKLITYMMPLCAPAAILGSLVLKRWLDGQYNGVLPRWAMRPWTVLMLTMLAGLGLGVAVEAAGPKLIARYAARTQGDGQAILAAFRASWALVALLAVAAVAACAQWWMLRRDSEPARTARSYALGVAWASLLIFGLGLSETEDQVLGLMRIREVAAEARQISEQEHASIMVFGTSGLSLNFYLQQQSRDVTLPELRQAVVGDQPLCIVADKDALDKLKEPDARLLNSFQRTPVLNPVPYDKPLCILWRSRPMAQVTQ